MEKTDVLVTIDLDAMKVVLRFSVDVDGAALYMTADEALEIASHLIEGANKLSPKVHR
jgi:hypothetical protein